VWALVTLLVVWLLARTFVGGIYRVDSGSMEPSIFGSDGGELVFVPYDRSRPARFDEVVLQRPGEDAPIVKRVVGLEGESVAIRHGDLLIDNARLGPAVARPAPILVFDGTRQEVGEHFRMGSSQSNPWTRADDVWTVDARAVPQNADAGLMFWTDPLRDSYFRPGGTRVEGEIEVNDARVGCEFRADDESGRVRLELLEQGDTFEAQISWSANGGDGKSAGSIDGDGDGKRSTSASIGDGKRSASASGAPHKPVPAEARLVRRNRDPEQVIARTEVELVPGRWHRLRFANIDNALTLDFDGHAALLQATYKENVFHATDAAKEGKSYGDRVRLGGEGARISFRSIQIWRDLYYTARGRFAVEAPIDLNPDQCFVLGDNSAASRDSREWGPVRLSEIVGRPFAVVWPPSHWRRISPVERAGPP
jgi:signal peptidase I